MKDVNQLWQERMSDYWSMSLRYWRLIGNNGLVLTMYILLIAGGYYYHQWLKQLPDAFPTVIILTIIFSIFLIRSPIRTFLQAPDIVFLLPLEEELGSYFQKSIRYSFLLQMVTITIILVVASPLYLARINSSVLSIVITLILLGAAKWWNSHCSWNEKYLNNRKDMHSYTVIRSVVTVIYTYFLLRQSSVYVIALMLVIMGILLFVVYRPLGKKYTLKWERIIEMDERMLLLFLKLANLFTDVPRLKSRIKPRRWLNGLTRGLGYRQSSAFKHFYLKTFLRANDYLGVYLRLVVIGGVVLYFLTGLYSQLIFAILFMYMTGLQLLTLWKHDIPQALGELYPIEDKIRESNYLTLLVWLLVIEGCIYGIISLLSGVWIVLIASIVAAFLFAYGIARKRIQKKTYVLQKR